MFLFSFYEGLLRPARITHPTTFLQDKGLWMFVSLIPLNKMESVHFRNGMLNKISNGIHPNYLDLGMMSNKEVSLTYLPFVRLDEQVRLGRGTINSLHQPYFKTTSYTKPMPASQWGPRCDRDEHERGNVEGRRVLVVFVRQDDDRDTEHPTTPVRPFPKQFPKSKSGPVPITKCFDFIDKPLPTIESDPTPKVSFESGCGCREHERHLLGQPRLRLSRTIDGFVGSSQQPEK
ncbi:hypothetical protein BLNAU_2103 [Blattamonas nauphoetae]|uniref:Uncharacterized protein n=1 Tax=Blattamonas nauphoetae TaxID=2049346 RepID=A0ABQ9YHF7_9EUKA|nr:hypothetical protein BLNAU_2103 [Blattamonas nauphoetae]